MKKILIVAGGTGGHIFPALAVAKAMLAQGWDVSWLGGAGQVNAPSMESQLIPTQRDLGFPIAFASVDFGGVRGKGLWTQLMLPWRLSIAMLQSFSVLRRKQPHVVLCLGGYISFPVGLVVRLMGIPLVLHEQNAIAGLANRALARWAQAILTAFPHVLTRQTEKVSFIGNPLREEFLRLAPPAARFQNRFGPLKLLVLGGSLGAQKLNELIPQALALIPLERRPEVIHQSGVKHLEATKAGYAAAQVTAQCVSFIEDNAIAMADADLIIARSGASTVTEIAAIGAAALFIPFPFAVDDHQSGNAAYLVNEGAAWMEQQVDLDIQTLAHFLRTLTREELFAKAQAAHSMARLDATQALLKTCTEQAL